MLSRSSIFYIRAKFPKNLMLTSKQFLPYFVQLFPFMMFHVASSISKIHVVKIDPSRATVVGLLQTPALWHVTIF